MSHKRGNSLPTPLAACIVVSGTQSFILLYAFNNVTMAGGSVNNAVSDSLNVTIAGGSVNNAVSDSLGYSSICKFTHLSCTDNKLC